MAALSVRESVANVLCRRVLYRGVGRAQPRARQTDVRTRGARSEREKTAMARREKRLRIAYESLIHQ